MANLNSSIINGFLRVTGRLKAGSISVDSNELVENLNADLLDGQQGSYYATSQGLTDLTTQVNTNTGNILTNMQNIKTNTEAIGTNKGNITSLTTRIGTAEGNITTNATNIATNTSNISKNTTDISTNTTNIATNTSDISALKTKTDTTNTNVTNLTSRVTTAEGNITTNTTDISSLKTKTDTTNTNVAANTENIAKILAGTATIPSVKNAEEADNAKKLGGQLPAYYAAKTDLNSYLPLTGGTITGQTKITGAAADKSFWVRGIMGMTSDGSAEDALYLNYSNQQPVYINGTNLVYHSGNIPSASTSQKGIVQLNNTRTSTSTTQAATANALKSAYDTLNTSITTHTGNTDVHLSTTDRAILTKANKFKGYYETETALNEAHPTGEAGDYAIVNATDTVWIWDADKEGGAGWKDGAGKGSVISVNNLTGEVVLTKTNIGLGNVDNTSDVNKPVSTAQQTALDGKVSKSGDTMSGDLTLNTKLVIKGDGRYITSDSTDNIYFAIGDVATTVVTSTAFRPSSSKKSTVSLGTADIKWKDLHLSGAASVGTSTTSGTFVNAGTYVQAGSYVKATTYSEATTYLKTGSGVVNFKDKVNIEYNATNECLEFNFS